LKTCKTFRVKDFEGKDIFERTYMRKMQPTFPKTEGLAAAPNQAASIQ